jgi:hypothetical protein
MRNSRELCSLAVIGSACAAVIVAPNLAPAFPTYLNAFREKYPTSTLPEQATATMGRACYVCHHPTSNSNEGNCYRLDIRARLNSAPFPSIEDVLAEVELLDSDGDGFSNLSEILFPRADLPGEVGYNPGLVGQFGFDPCFDPTTPLTGRQESPNCPCAADFDRSGGTPDAGDIDAFFIAWLAGDPTADTDCSGGTPDTNDIEDFFAQWLGGGC